MLEFQNISLVFEERSIFTNLNFQIKDGEKVLLKGRSGIGKSTIFNLILGFLFPQGGEILWNGRAYSPEVVREVRRSTTWLPQATNLFRDISAIEAIELAFQNKQNKNALPDRDSMFKLAQKYSLDLAILDKEVSTLSGGELQRIMLIASMLQNRKLTLMDEPASALDEATSDIIMHDIIKNTDTLLLISHNSKYDNLFSKIINL